ncbi:MAG: Crp/Fnr family transcriptional regulator [Salinarimonas sp.]|nr:Crp/Fnr family transcriptional regulator [Salinarimonas sp.]
MAKEPQSAFDARTFLARLGNDARIADFVTDQAVFEQGDAADAVYYVQTGKVKLSVLSEQGKGAVIALLGPGDFFGEGCLAGQTMCISSAVAMADTQVIRIDKRTIQKLIADDPAFSEVFVAHLLERAVRVEADLIDQLFNSSEKRLARLLLILANFGKDGEPEPILAEISQETLAQMIGTTRPRVSHFMNKFRKLGFISYNGRIEVHRSLLNAVLRDQPYTDHE